MLEPMSTTATSLDEIVRLLRQALEWYKGTGPDSMQSLTGSFLTPRSTAGSAGPPAGVIAEAFRTFDGATDALLTGFAARHGFDLADLMGYFVDTLDDRLDAFFLPEVERTGKTNRRKGRTRHASA